METSSSPTSPQVFRSARTGKNLILLSERTSQNQPLTDRLAAREAALEAALATVNAAFSILGSRALVILASVGAFTLFGWTALEPSGWRFAAAVAFTVLVFAPALWVDRRS